MSMLQQVTTNNDLELVYWESLGEYNQAKELLKSTVIFRKKNFRRRNNVVAERNNESHQCVIS